MDRVDHNSSGIISTEEQLRHVPDKTCETCGRCFARNEHLIRHRRTHTMERPFLCAHCNIGFPRSDVRERHMKRLHPEEGSVSQTLPQVSEKRQKPNERERSKLACDQCRKRKLKCNNIRPCDSCRTKLLVCTISVSSRPAGRPPNRVPISPTAPVALENDTTVSTVSSSFPGPWTPGGFEPSLDEPNSMPRTADRVELGIADGTAGHPNAIGISPSYMGQGIASDIANSTRTLIPCGSLPLDQIWQGVDIMDDLLPQVYLGNWFGDLDEFSTMDDLGPLDFLTSDIDSNPSTANAVYVMEEYFQRRSRAPSLSGEEPNRAWYSAPPQLYIYDEEVINVLLNLARTHISSTFAIFSDFEATHDTRVELCLAMSAVGGLYCTAQGGTKVAKKLFNDSRRLFLEYNLQKSSPTFDESLSFAKTFILLEIYGLCSGDKRAFEFVEVFHASKVEAISSCLSSLPHNASLDKCREVKLLLEAIQVLDSYRVLLLQHPPSFAPQQHFSSHGSNEMCKFQRASTSGLIALLSPGSPVDQPAVDMHHLTTIISYGWMASLQDLESFSYPTLWKPEFVELALNRWIQAKTRGTETHHPSEVPQMLLFHLAHVSLHSNLRNLQRLTQEAVRSVQQSQKRGIPDSIRAWRNSSHFNIAHWHAITILRMAQEAMAPRSRYQPSERDKLQFAEAPHLPFCIYFASLIVWYGAVALSGDSCSGDVSIEEGSQLLFRLKAQVSKQLGAALCELRSNGSRDAS